MDLSINEIFYALSLREGKHNNVQIQKREQALREEQRDSIRMDDPCTDHVADILLSLGSFGENVKKIFEDSFNNPGVLEFLQCIVAAVNYSSFSDEEQRRRLRYWITDFVLVGGKSAQGYAFSTSIAQTPSTYLTKVNKIKADFPDTVHEYFVGRFGTNQVRKEGIPNFSFVFDFFSCSVPIVEDTEVLTWCTREGRGGYIVQEYVPGDTLETKLPSLSAQEFLDVYVQLLLALRTAHKQIDFTHYDLHPGNVILRPLDKQVAIQYPAPARMERGFFDIPQVVDRHVYLVTDTIATMVDYSYAHIRHKDKHYGYFGLPQYGVQPAKSFPLFDAFKLLCFSLRKMHPKTKEQLLPLLSFFVIDPEDTLDKGLDIFYALPDNEQTRSKDLDDLLFVLEGEALKHSSLQGRLLSTKPEDTPTLDDAYSSASDILSLIRPLSFGRSSPGRSSPSAYSLLYSLLPSRMPKDMFQVHERQLLGLPGYTSPATKVRTFANIESLFSTLLSLEQNIHLPEEDVSPEHVLDNLESFRKLFGDVARLYDTHQRIKTNIGVLDKIPPRILYIETRSRKAQEIVDKSNKLLRQVLIQAKTKSVDLSSLRQFVLV